MYPSSSTSTPWTGTQVWPTDSFRACLVSRIARAVTITSTRSTAFKLPRSFFMRFHLPQEAGQAFFSLFSKNPVCFRNQLVPKGVTLFGSSRTWMNRSAPILHVRWLPISVHGWPKVPAWLSKLLWPWRCRDRSWSLLTSSIAPPLCQPNTQYFPQLLEVVPPSMGIARGLRYHPSSSRW